MAIIVQLGWGFEYDPQLGPVPVPEVASVKGIRGGKTNVATEIEKAIRFRDDGLLTIDWDATPYGDWRHRFIVKLPPEKPQPQQKSNFSASEWRFRR